MFCPVISEDPMAIQHGMCYKDIFITLEDDIKGSKLHSYSFLQGFCMGLRSVSSECFRNFFNGEMSEFIDSDQVMLFNIPSMN